MPSLPKDRRLGRPSHYVRKFSSRSVAWSVIALASLSTLLRTACRVNWEQKSARRITTFEEYSHDHLVHVIQTRFQQWQPHLIELGRARLELFRHITLPSVRQQSNQNFLWILRTDPDLPKELLSQLQQLALPNMILLRSNDNPEGFRDITFNRNELAAGDWNLLQSYQAAARENTVLETRLDADDALSLDFVHLLQEDAKSMRSWTVWCVQNHVEWQEYNPWNSTDDRFGSFIGVKTRHCVTPGLTWGYSMGVSRRDIGAPSHHQLIGLKVPPCQQTKTKCLRRLDHPKSAPLALRARSITSAGMANVVLRHQDPNGGDSQRAILEQSHWRNIQHEMWRDVPPLFGLQQMDFVQVRLHLEAHLPLIVVDALQGQCTKGHSCKTASREVLRQLLNKTEYSSVQLTT